ncbi:MAG: sulfite exporter TauE/SafE family protein, partial [Alphaproteobacteria bacterium]|nr:sulfite exporter TauE/SafE family protein [Alphaproteobacteria bacterium]
LLTAVLLLTRSWLLRVLSPRLGPDGPRHAAALTIATGVGLGVLVSLSSVGAGALGVTALFLLYPRMPTSRIIGSDIAHAVPLTLLAGLGHWLLNSVDVTLLLTLLSGSIPGIIIGSLIAVRVPDRVIRPALACVLVLVGGRLVF